MELQVDIFHSGQWHHAAVLELLNPEQGRLSPTRLMYLQDYALDWMFRDDRFSCSINLPIELMFHHRSNQWFGFLEDIVPSGASRRFWVNRLVAKLTNQQQVLNGSLEFDPQQCISEWLKRNLLNVIFGNSDNHGRNTAFVKIASGITLAPVYDFTPMRADPEGVIRAMKWGAPFDQGDGNEFY